MIKIVKIIEGKTLWATLQNFEREKFCKLRRETKVSFNFFFMPGRSVMKAICLLRHLIESSKDKQQDLHMIFLDLKNVWLSPQRSLVRGFWEENKTKLHIYVIKNMCHQADLCVRICTSDIQAFSIIIELH